MPDPRGRSGLRPRRCGHGRPVPGRPRAAAHDQAGIPGGRAGGRAGARPGQLPGYHHGAVAAAAARADRDPPGGALRPPGPRRLPRAPRPLPHRRAGRRPARPARPPARGPGRHRRAVPRRHGRDVGRRPRARAGPAARVARHVRPAGAARGVARAGGRGTGGRYRGGGRHRGRALVHAAVRPGLAGGGGVGAGDAARHPGRGVRRVLRGHRRAGPDASARPHHRTDARGRRRGRPRAAGTAQRRDRRRRQRRAPGRGGRRAPGQPGTAGDRDRPARRLLRGRRPVSARPDFVQSLERGLAVIRAFDRTRPELTLSEVAAATGVTRAAARRFLLTLVDLGYVRSDGRLFALSPRVLELGYAYLSSLSLPEVAEPHLEALVGEVNESSSVSVLDAGDVVYVARVPTSRIMTVAISVGTRFPAYATSMGRVLLAELARVRAQGWAIVDQELEEGLRAVAAPIRNRDGRTVAAINISAHASRTPVESVRRRLLPPLLAAAARIEADLPARIPGTG